MASFFFIFQGLPLLSPALSHRGGSHKREVFLGSDPAKNAWRPFPKKPPLPVLRAAAHTKTVGERWDLEPLTTAEFTLDDTFNGHTLSIVTCGLIEKYCYYKGRHSGGAVFTAFSGVPDSVFAPVDVQKFISITMQCIQQFHIDHKIFVEGFLSWNNTEYEWNNQTLLAHFQQDLKIEFEQGNDFSRICSVNTVLSGK